MLVVHLKALTKAILFLVDKILLSVNSCEEQIYADLPIAIIQVSLRRSSNAQLATHLLRIDLN